MSSADLDASLDALQPTALVAPFSRGAAGGSVAPRPAAQPPTFRASSIYTQADGFVPDTSVAARTVVMTESASGGVAAKGGAASAKQAADLSKHIGYAEKHGKGGV
jgi:hypothetical protein